MVLCLLFLAIAGSATAMELVLAGKLVVTPAKSSIRGVDLSSDEAYIYVVGMSEKSVIKANIATGEMVKASLADLGAKVAPKAVSVDSNNRAWVGLATSAVAVLSPDMQLEAVYDLSAYGLTTIEGVLVSPSGDIYITNRDNVTPGIFKFRLQDGQLAPVNSWGKVGYVSVTELRQPVLTPSGDLLMTSWTAGKITLVKADTGDASLFIQAKRTFFLDVDGAGYVYVVSYDTKDAGLSVYKPDGTLLREWSMAELGVTTQTSSVAVSRDGKRLYIFDQAAAQGGTVLIFDVKN